MAARSTRLRGREPNHSPSAVDKLGRISVDGRIDTDVVNRLAGPRGPRPTRRSPRRAPPSRDSTARGTPACWRAASRSTATSSWAPRKASGLPAPRRRCCRAWSARTGRATTCSSSRTTRRSGATGGLPGSWARVHAEDGKLSMVEQGTAGTFPQATDASAAVVRTGSWPSTTTCSAPTSRTPASPRTSRGPRNCGRRGGTQVFPETSLDGVLALDPVAMSYLLEGTGPVDVGATTLTAANVVDELLNRPYLELEPAGAGCLVPGVRQGHLRGEHVGPAARR